MRKAIVLLVGIVAVFGLGFLIGLAGQGPPKRVTVERTVSTAVTPPDCLTAVAAAGDVISHSGETISSANAVIAAESEVIRLIGQSLLVPVGPQTSTASDQITSLQQQVQDESVQLASRRPILDDAVARFVRSARGCK